MSWRAFFNGRFGRWLLSKQPLSAEPLREFVYLDEVSVYSLLASQVGPIASEFTDIQSSTSKRTYESTFQFDFKVAKAGDKASDEASSSRSSQVLRKSSVQFAFRQLRDNQSRHLLLNQIKGQLPKLTEPSALQELASDKAFDGLCLDAHALKRGRLLEIEVELEPDPVFEFYATMSGMLDLVGGHANTLLQGRSSAEIEQLRAFQGILDRILIGLVPIRSRALHYSVVRVADEQFVVHESVVKHFEASGVELEVQPLYVAGVAKQALFWRDIRSFLFSRRSFHVYCRVAKDGLSGSWSPVKMLDMFEPFLPQQAFGLDALATMKPSASVVPADDKTPTGVHAVLEQRLTVFAERLAEECSFELIAADHQNVETIALEAASSDSTAEAQRKPFVALSDAMAKTHNVEISRDLMARLRSEVQGNEDTHQASRSEPPLDERGVFLECEFVAIYW